MSEITTIQVEKADIVDASVKVIDALMGTPGVIAVGGAVLAAGTIMNGGTLGEELENAVVESTVGHLSTLLATPEGGVQ